MKKNHKEESNNTQRVPKHISAQMLTRNLRRQTCEEARRERVVIPTQPTTD